MSKFKVGDEVVVTGIKEIGVVRSIASGVQPYLIRWPDGFIMECAEWELSIPTPSVAPPSH